MTPALLRKGAAKQHYRCLAMHGDQQPEACASASTSEDCRHAPASCTNQRNSRDITVGQTRASSQSFKLNGLPAQLLLGAVCSALAMPGSASAAESLSGGAVDVFRQFLEQVEAMGPWGAVVFVVAVMLSEMIPLFPTQPLSLASGLLFGGQKGALLMLIGVTLAATNAFLISRGVGRPLAEKIIKMEMGDGTEEGTGSSSVAGKLLEVQSAIESGSPWQQFTAIVLLRLTPVVPFSASNYILGLTPVQLPALLAGTVAGMSVWSLLYASLGGASRSLLDGDTDIADVFAELGEQSKALSQNVALVALGLGAVALLVAGISQATKKPEDSTLNTTEEEEAEQYTKEEAYHKK